MHARARWPPLCAVFGFMRCFWIAVGNTAAPTSKIRRPVSTMPSLPKSGTWRRIRLIEEGHRLLDLGCGFGGLALYAAECCGAHATGITLSQEQLAKARRRAGAPRAASGRPHSVPRPRLSRRLGAISRTKFEAQLPMERSVVGDADKQQRASVGSAVATAGAAICDRLRGGSLWRFSSGHVA